MILVFYCYGGAHTSVTAANLCLGRLPRRRPSLRALGTQPAFDRCRHQDLGRPIFMGIAPTGDRVYCLGLGAGKDRLARALLELCRLLADGSADIAMVNALPTANWLMRVGGFLSRRVGLLSVGRPLVTAGVWLAYPRFIGLIDRAQAGRQAMRQAGRQATRQAARQGSSRPTAPWELPAPAPDRGDSGTAFRLPVDGLPALVDNRNSPFTLGVGAFSEGGCAPPHRRAGTEDRHAQGTKSHHP